MWGKGKDALLIRGGHLLPGIEVANLVARVTVKIYSQYGVVGSLICDDTCRQVGFTFEMTDG